MREIEPDPPAARPNEGVRQLLDALGSKENIQVTDDQTDESMFELKLPHLISIKVGAGPSRARYRFADPAAFRAFLQTAL